MACQARQQRRYHAKFRRSPRVQTRTYAVPAERLMSALHAVSTTCTSAALEMSPLQQVETNNGFVVLTVPYEAALGHEAIDAAVGYWGRL